MYKFAGVAGIQPSTMQTKIRAMIRYGFVRDGHSCPLIWTRMGSLWNDLFTVGNVSSARKIYDLILVTSLALFAFNNSSQQFSTNPTKGDMPLKFLFNILDAQNSISLTEFEALVDGNTSRIGKNTSYWKRDLLNCGLFREELGKLIYTGAYPELVNEIKGLIPNKLLDGADWQNIRDNPLLPISPFSASVQKIFEHLAEENITSDQAVNAKITEPLVDIVAEQEEQSIPEADILSTITKFSQSTRRVRNTTWSIRIKKKYNYLCAVPNCDVNGKLFIGAAHIKPDRVPEDTIPHRTHTLNGLCLCNNCHIAFDKGFFSLTDDCKIITSSRFDSIPDQNLKTVILSSANLRIKNRVDDRFPLVDFIKYHRINCFQR
jgi:hypothetical protein